MAREGVGTYDGLFVRITCSECAETVEVEDSVTNGETIDCDACGARLTVEGAP